ncbi:hypothetical protein IWQ62_001063, partial [Dispira parvispora]
MVPQDVFALKYFPLTVTGNVDKAALKCVLEQRLASSNECSIMGPSNPAEKTIHRAMGETLDIPLEHLDVRDSFFQVGGDSISAIRFSSLCREGGIRLSLTQIFQHKTVAALGKLVNGVIKTEITLPALAPWELELLDQGMVTIPTESITFAVAGEMMSILLSILTSVVTAKSPFNSRYDHINHRLVPQSHPAVVIEQDVDASQRLDPIRGEWLSGAYTQCCNGLNLVTLVAHRVLLGKVGGWSTVLQDLAKQCPNLVMAPQSSVADSVSASVTLSDSPNHIHYLTVPYCGNPFNDDLSHSGLNIPLSIVVLEGFLTTLYRMGNFESVSIAGSGCLAAWDAKYQHYEKPTSVAAEFQLIKQWYYDHLVQGQHTGTLDAPSIYHYSDVAQPHGVPVLGQHASFWDVPVSIQAAVVYQPNSLVLQLYHQDRSIAESILITWQEQINLFLGLLSHLQGTEHTLIPADFPLLALSTGDLDELVSDMHQDLNIPPNAIYDIYPLSTMQRNFVVNTLQDPTSYIVQHTFRITGVFNPEKYRAVWAELGNRHTILRTKFLASRMVQVVTNQMEIDWVVSDTTLPTTEEEYQLTVRQLGFDLSGRNPLLRIHLFPDVNGQGWLCFLAIHHAMIDGWSYQLLINESLDLYHGVHMRDEVPYFRFIESVSTQDFALDKSYWTEGLAEFNSTPDLPFPHLSQVTLYRKDAVVSNQTTPLHHLCHNLGITFNVLLRGVWALMLTQFLGKPDEVTFGVMVTGRDGQIAGLDRLVGPTINTLPFHAKVDPRESIIAWLKKLARQSTELLAHEQTSLVDIKHWAGIDMDDQLFGSVMTFGKYIESRASLHDSLIKYHSVTSYNQTEYPLMGLFDEPVPGESLHLVIMAKHEPFYIDGLVDHITHLLSQLAIVDPTSYLVDTLLQPSPTALNQVQAWIPGPTLKPSNPDVLMVPDLFTQNLADQPHRVALETKDCRYTYCDFHVQACRVGRALLDRGLQPGDKVALLFSRSAYYFMAVLGTWLVGGIAVPMDATNAPSRLQYMVDSLGEGAFLVTQTADDSGQVVLPDFYTAKLVVEDLTLPDGPVFDLPSFPRDPTMLALIIYTSGTTGVPKGVALHHESIVNYVSYVTQLVDVPATCRFLQALNIAFDGCFMETLPAWAVGGTLVLQDGELADDLQRVTHCLLTPSLLGVLIPENYPQLELVISGGEALPYNFANRWLAAGKRVLNVCGPTEITMACHMDLIPSHEP